MLMLRNIRILAAVVFASVTLLTGGATASAQPQQDGLVNIVIGDVTILKDVNIGLSRCC